jgi:hypothetical protein
MNEDSGMTEIDVTDVEPFTEEEMCALVRRAIADPGSFLPREEGETVPNWGARAVLTVINEDARNRAAVQIADESRIEAMDFRNGAKMRLLPAQTIAARTVAAARTLLGEAPNYSETTVEFTTKLAGEAEKYSFVVQRVAPGKLTPHEARQQAEADRDRARDIAVALGQQLGAIEELISMGDEEAGDVIRAIRLIFRTNGGEAL